MFPTAFRMLTVLEGIQLACQYIFGLGKVQSTIITMDFIAFSMIDYYIWDAYLE